MASVVSPVERGVPPIRAGKGHSFLLRRLHSLSGIIPIGAFLLEHFISNAFATNGPKAYADQVKFLTGLPFVLVLETVGIYIPLLYHALYGFYIWFRGESNVSESQLRELILADADLQTFGLRPLTENQTIRRQTWESLESGTSPAQRVAQLLGRGNYVP